MLFIHNTLRPYYVQMIMATEKKTDKQTEFGVYMCFEIENKEI